MKPFFVLEDFDDMNLRHDLSGGMGPSPRLVAQRANAKLEGKVVVDANEYVQLRASHELALKLEAELESLRKLKAEVDAAPWVYFDDGPPIEGKYVGASLTPDGTEQGYSSHRAKLVRIEELEK